MTLNYYEIIKNNKNYFGKCMCPNPLVKKYFAKSVKM